MAIYSMNDANLEKALAESDVKLRKALVIHETTLPRESLETLMSHGVQVLMLPKDLRVCNEYKNTFRRYRLFSIVFDNDVARMSDVDLLVVPDGFSADKIPLKLASNAKMIIAEASFSGFARVSGKLQARDSHVIVSSNSRKTEQASIVKVIGVKPFVVDYGDGTELKNGRLEIGVRATDLRSIEKVGYIDYHVTPFSEAPADGCVCVSKATDKKMKALLDLLSDAEFKVVVQEGGLK